MTSASRVLWSPSSESIENSHINRFKAFVKEQQGVDVGDYDGLYQWSINEPGPFWSAIWDYSNVKASVRSSVAMGDSKRMMETQFFPEAQLNFAENLLVKNDDTDAIVFRGENKASARLSWAELNQQVSSVQQYLKGKGLQAGDRVAALLPNMPETVVAMLATTATGGVWSSCSPEFGLQGILDRFGQIEPKVLLVADGYYYNGKVIDVTDKVIQLIEQLPSVKAVIRVPYVGLDTEVSNVDVWGDLLADNEAGDIEFEQLPFNHPLYIMFSSGTTGKPKCIVHGVGGSLLQHHKEHKLHCDIKPGDKVFYFTTCTWMMWNWLISALASEATLMLYDGSPFYPNANVLFDYAEQEKVTFFGTSAKYIDALKKADRHPINTHDLSSVRAIASTGSPLMPASFDYVYESISKDVCLASISGGTDILSCFVLGNPTAPVRRGEIQTRGLGMAVEVWDDNGNPIVGEKGEMVCTKPFPSMPIGFWNDPDNARYKSAYFEQYDNIWAHGDFAEITENGGFIIYGRSDATLNPGGVRIGTAEIYRQVEVHPDVTEAIAIGQDFDDDVRVVLFVVLQGDKVLGDDLIQDLKSRIRKGASPRHVPAKIIQVPEIPRTASGKIVEMAVRDVVHGRVVKNKESLANPDALKHFENLPQLES